MQSVGLLLQAGVTHYTLIYDREKGHDCLQYVIHMMPLRRYVQGTVEAVHSHKQLLVKKPLLEYTVILFTTCVYVLSNQGWSPVSVQPPRDH